MQYRALRHARINGHDYAPGELIADPGALRNPRSLVSARYIMPAGDDVPADVVAPDQGPELEAQGANKVVTGRLDADEIGKWTRERLESVAAEMGIKDVDDKSVYPNKDALIAVMVTMPVADPVTDVHPDEDVP